MRLPLISLLLVLHGTACNQSSQRVGEPVPAKKSSDGLKTVKDKAPSDKSSTGAALTYEDIKPIIDKQCGGTDCHGANGKHSPDLSNAHRVSANGAAIMRKINVNMPPENSGRKLTKADRDKFEAWKLNKFATGGDVEVEEPEDEEATDEESSEISQSGDVVEFRIKAGTGNGAWNTAANPIRLKVGQELRVTNDDSIQHFIHTNGAPFFHPFAGINPGETKSYRMQSKFTGGSAVHDHNTYGDIHMIVD
jgi:hypothetical protein